MKNAIINKIRKIEFEWRIFISLFIVAFISFLSFGIYRDLPPISICLGHLIGLSEIISGPAGFIVSALLMVAASYLRISAGSLLSSRRVMAFKVQSNHLERQGLYRWVRNPIYFADLIAFCGFAFIMNLVGIILPLILFLHYLQLIVYEEHSLQKNFGEEFLNYKRNTPMILPRLRDWKNLWVGNQIHINRDGLRHNALYLLFIPGFIISAFTGSVLAGVLIGIPAVIDWAIVHTRIGIFA